MGKRLELSSTDRKIGGVCGGLAEYLGVDPTLMRLLFVLLAILTAVVPMVVFYLLAWLLMPRRRPEAE